MKHFIYLALLGSWLFTACNQAEKPKTENMNPLLANFDGEFGIAPFESIKEEHYVPAFEEAMKLNIAEIDAITSNPDSATFENTIVALDNTGEKLETISALFFNLNDANTSDSMQSIAKIVAPKLSQHSDNILLNEKLFARVNAVYQKKETLNLSSEQLKLLTDAWKMFVRNGANLNPTDKETLKKINEELSLLTIQFGENVLAETNEFKLVIEKKEDLAGLPNSVIEASAADAKAAGMDGKWLFTLHNPSRLPFLQYSAKRELREKIFKAYIQRGDNNNQYDNKNLIAKIVDLRSKKAALLGYKTHADYVLENTMAKTPVQVYDLLDKLWKPALQLAANEAKELQKLLTKDDAKAKLEAWDWWYYTEKLRKEKYDIDEEQVRPYFKLENVRDGIFALSNKLYGITFTERNDLPKYHPEVMVYEVKEKDGKHLGILMMDFYPRASKRGGAWMTEFRRQFNQNGNDIRPVISLVCNFTKPTETTPSLLSADEVSTFFHEFGHGLHGMLSQVQYRSQSGTSVARDFVELPSQIMENWAFEPEMLNLYATHYSTKELIPAELVKKLEASAKFNQGFAMTEYLSASYLDMKWHTLTNAEGLDINKFESDNLKQLGLMPEIVVRYRSTYFSHIFSGGYSAGYYSYIWSELLDADAFAAFKEKNIFDAATASLFREHVLSKGGTDEPMNLYVKFRGKTPDIKPLLERKGVKI